MIDKNKPLEDYTKEELLDALNSKKELDSYYILNLVFEENKKSNKYYFYFEDFLKMIYSKTSFGRMRGFSLCASLAKYDIQNKIDNHLNDMLILLEDNKPTTVRIVLSSIVDILKYKPYLSNVIKDNLNRINLDLYKDSMRPLIIKDINKVKEIIEAIGKEK